MKIPSLLMILLIAMQFQHVTAQELDIKPALLDFGTIEQASYLKSYFVISNTGNKPLVLLRADAGKGMLVSSAKKIIAPGDTAHLIIQLWPEREGKFRETIRLHTNVSDNPASIQLKGELKKVLSRDLAACVNFNPKTQGSGPGAIIPLITTHSVTFIDSASRQPINEAAILYVSRLTREKSERTTTSGQLSTNVPVGPYALVITAPGYRTLVSEQYIA